MSKAAAVMSLGQISEVDYFIITSFFKTIRNQTNFVVGMIAWVLRYILFAYGDVGGELDVNFSVFYTGYVMISFLFLVRFIQILKL